MGLEAVEIVIKIEERFQTRIPDFEAEYISTVGKLYEFLMRRIQRQNSSHCITSSIFYSIRQILVNNYGANRKDIRPISILSELIPQIERFKFWQTVEQKLSVDLPRLKRSKMIQWNGDCFPENIETVGDLTHECCHLSSITDEFQLLDKQLIWIEVCQIVGEVANVNPESLMPATNFFRDLGF